MKGKQNNAAEVLPSQGSGEKYSDINSNDNHATETVKVPEKENARQAINNPVPDNKPVADINGVKKKMGRSEISSKEVISQVGSGSGNKKNTKRKNLGPRQNISVENPEQEIIKDSGLFVQVERTPDITASPKN